MKLGLVLHEADPFSFSGVGDDGSGLALYCFGLAKGSDNLTQVMSIDLDSMPAESAPLFRKGFGIHHVAAPAIYLQAVAVNYSYRRT
jgi:hypothetical protein